MARAAHNEAQPHCLALQRAQVGAHAAPRHRRVEADHFHARLFANLDGCTRSFRPYNVTENHFMTSGPLQRQRETAACARVSQSRVRACDRELRSVLSGPLGVESRGLN